MRSLWMAVALAGGVAIGQDADAELAARVKKLDEQFVPALAELARAYDEKKDPEAASFFCECALGLGGADGKLEELKKKWEDEVYYGRSRGGKVLEDTLPIERKLSGLAKEYRSVVDALTREGQSKGISEEAKRVLHGVVVKAELARGAYEYVQATQRFNELRRCMKLRAILWDYEASSKLILAGWHMCETRDWEWEEKSHVEAFTYTPAVEFAKQKSARSPESDYPLRRHADDVRTMALMKRHLLNPDARRLWLGHWVGGAKFKDMTLYMIPRLEYRPDVATPTTRYRGETVAQDRDLWADVEETIKIGDKRVVVSCYPYDDEPDAPRAFGDGRTGENLWSDPKAEPLPKRGLPVMVRFFVETTPTDVQVELRRKKGSAVSCRIYLNGDERVRLDQLATILVLPEKHLEPQTTYAVSIKCKIEGVAFEKSWSFTTRAKWAVPEPHRDP